MSYYLVKMLSFIVCLLPDKFRNTLGDIIGSVCWPLVSAKRRTMAVNNVIHCLNVDPDRAQEIVRKSSVRFGRMFLEVLCFPKMNSRNIDRLITWEGRQYLEQAFAAQRGVVLVTSHSGNWELGGAAVALSGFPLGSVVQRQTNAAMDRLINEFRELSGMKVIYKTGVKQMAGLLGEGRGIGLLMDQDAKGQGAFVEFFGRSASAPKGAATLARMKGSPIVPMFITQKSDGQNTLIVHPLVWVDKTADREADIYRTTQELTTIIEQHIREYPEEWFWLHNRWKTKPPAER